MTTLETVQRECDRVAAQVRRAHEEAQALPEGEARTVWLARRQALTEGLFCLCRVKRSLLAGEAAVATGKSAVVRRVAEGMGLEVVDIGGGVA